jgi:hypothetical protein
LYWQVRNFASVLFAGFSRRLVRTKKPPVSQRLFVI